MVWLIDTINNKTSGSSGSGELDIGGGLTARNLWLTRDEQDLVVNDWVEYANALVVSGELPQSRRRGKADWKAAQQHFVRALDLWHRNTRIPDADAISAYYNLAVIGVGPPCRFAPRVWARDPS